MKRQLGRHVYGLAAVAFGVIALRWQAFNGWQQLRALGSLAHDALLLDAVAALEVLGGVALQWPRTARAGALALGAVYLAFALDWVPLIAASPLVYDRWGNFFEQFSLVSGALIVFALSGGSASPRAPRVARAGYLAFGVCVVSFTLEQLVYLPGTAAYVPGWIPPGRMFWAVVTTIAFALAALALLSGRSALLASRLLTVMLVGFGVLVWLPAPFAAPHALMSWAGNAENLAITGSAWIVTDFLGGSRSGRAAALPSSGGAPGGRA